MSGGHALVVRGTGMLAPLARMLADDGWRVSVVGCGRADVSQVPEGRRMHLISTNYRDSFEYQAELIDAIVRLGRIDLAVCWIPATAPEALRATARFIAPGGRLFHVLGSAGQDLADARPTELTGRTDVAYRRVVLGERRADAKRRRLTDDEISRSVLDAIRRDDPGLIIGTLGAE